MKTNNFFYNGTPYLLAYLLIGWVFINWVLSPVNLGGDFNFVNYDHFRIYANRPYIWDFALNNGFGQIILFTLPFYYYGLLLNTLTGFIVNPFLLHKIIFFLPLIAISTVSITILARQLQKNSWANAVTILLYLLNPYFLMLTSGGQLGVALAYGFSPLVVATYFKTLHILVESPSKSHKLKWILISALTAAVLISFDSRLALLVLLMIVARYLVAIKGFQEKKKLTTMFIIQGLLTSVVIIGYHSFWILPSLFVQSVALPQGYATTQAVEFFSFGRLAHTITWTHPNYPDNLFGVVREINWLAVIFPILAFWSLRKPSQKTVYFSAVAILSAFLAKGTSEPFGQIYLWAFQHLPGFSWFRDSTKFFLPLSIAYAILIGTFFEELFVSSYAKTTKWFLSLVAVVAIGLVWAPTFMHNIKGTLAYRTYPNNFQEIEKILKADTTYGRVLWIPSREMYGYYDNNHPAVALQELRNYPTCIAPLCLPNNLISTDKKEFTKKDLTDQIDTQTAFLDDPYTQDLFQKLAINYIVVAPDNDHSLYIYDRKFAPDIKQYYQQKVNNVSWIQPIGPLYKTVKKGSLLTQSTDFTKTNTIYSMINPVKYALTIENTVQPLTFSQRFDPHWQLFQDNKKIVPTADQNGLMQFSTSELHNGPATLRLLGQQYADIGLGISIAIIAISLGVIVVLNKKVGEKTV